MAIDINKYLERLGIKKPKPTTEERKRILLLKPGEIDPAGHEILYEHYERAQRYISENPNRVRNYLGEAFDVCIEDVKYNPLEAINCICTKMKDKKFKEDHWRWKV